MPETQPTALEVELALSLDAVRAERDAALARAEAAEALVKSVQNDAPHQLKRLAELHQRATTAEERVRVLEAILTQWLQGLDMMRTLATHDTRQATVVEILTKAEIEARAALAKTAPAAGATGRDGGE